MSQKQQPAKLSKLDQLRERGRRAEEGGGAARIEKQHAAGKMTARERVEFLLDDETFQEFDKLVQHRSQDFGLFSIARRTSVSTNRNIRAMALLPATA
jgi:acetyl-CoA carboxylase carboxyltransferase component